MSPFDVYDPLYGQFAIGGSLAELATAPEVRRLSQVRLLNTLTPSLATLGEIRRYSHTLGVLRLASESPFPGVSPETRDAFLAAVLLHDVGTPPFGHLAEYELRNRYGWNHEAAIGPILHGRHAPENTAHQIFAGQPAQFYSRLSNVGLHAELVEQIATGTHWLSCLLFGSVDFDNLDNVARMGWAVGRAEGIEPALTLARNLWPSDSGLLLAERFRGQVRTWLDLRRAVYEIIVFDWPTVAAQAVLAEALATLIAEGKWTRDEWSLTDEDLLRLFRSHPATKRTISREFLGTLPSHLLTLQIDGTLSDLGHETQRAAADALRLHLQDNLGTRVAPLTYAFVDHGAFSKSLTFVDPTSGLEWKEGADSRSVVLYAFLRQTQRPGRSRLHDAARRTIAAMGIDPARLHRVEIGEADRSTRPQLSLIDASARD